jgi:hypothetical protein
MIQTQIRAVGGVKRKKLKHMLRFILLNLRTKGMHLPAIKGAPKFTTMGKNYFPGPLTTELMLIHSLLEDGSIPALPKHGAHLLPSKINR